MIDLEQILDDLYDKDYRSSYKTEYPKQCILAAMKEACEQVIDLCAEKAEIDFKNIEGDTCLGNLDPYTEYFVDKESIIAVKDLIK